jgi:hypothetical protein
MIQRWVQWLKLGQAFQEHGSQQSSNSRDQRHVPACGLATDVGRSRHGYGGCSATRDAIVDANVIARHADADPSCPKLRRIPSSSGAYRATTGRPSALARQGLLAFHHSPPWPLMSFLADAHQRGVLRQAGAVYQFGQLELQHRLATRPSGPHPESATGWRVTRSP